MRKPWPRLTESLAPPMFAADPWHCQSCGVMGAIDQSNEPPLYAGPLDPLSAWQEHDEDDQPEARAVVLCEPCADRIIEPHPRLYRRLERYEPLAGLMAICAECIFRAGTRCTSPQARINGGGGIEIIHPKPSHTHICGRGRKGPCCQTITLYHGPAVACSGRLTNPEAAPTPDPSTPCQHPIRRQSPPHAASRREPPPTTDGPDKPKSPENAASRRQTPAVAALLLDCPPMDSNHQPAD